MSFFKKDKEKERYYLFAGMGGKAFRRKQNVFLVWSLFAAVVVSLALAVIMYFFNLQR